MVKTMTLHLDASADKVLHIPLPPDIPKGPLQVVVVIAPAQPVTLTPDMAGRWQAYFPTDFDIDNALREIRHEWEKEWTEEEL